MRHVAFAALLLLLIPQSAAALETEELLGLVAMPLAVAAASEVTGVPASELSNLVATLNRANVRPTQVVQVVRYAPAALVVETEQPAFVEFVDAEVDRGITGSYLVTSIDRRLRTYEVEPQFVVLEEPATTFVLSDDFIPPLVVTRVTQLRTASPVIGDTNDLLALIAMPLAVSAVSEITGVPMNELADLVATLNGANVAPVQVIEVLRYAPVALVGDDDFVQYVSVQASDGLTGTRLVDVIEQRLQTYDVTPQLALAPRSTVVVDETFIPTVVRTRVAEARSGHPHGGPPGQIKKVIGVKTGAEVVHGNRAATRTVDAEKPRRVKVDRKPKNEGRGGPEMRRVPPGQQRKIERNDSSGGGNPGRGQSQNRGQGNAQSKGKGKGKD